VSIPERAARGGARGDSPTLRDASPREITHPGLDGDPAIGDIAVVPFDVFLPEGASMLKHRIQKRLASEGGFTLIELLVVLVIIGILLAIAVPSYLGFKDRANQRAAESNVRAAIPSAEAFYADNGTYVGLDNLATGTPKGFASYDAGTAPKVTIHGLSATGYCILSDVNGKVASLTGPGGDVVETACP
jgi:prepilin-type N-terminal cleavage/methylation domain-containing protein